MMNRTMLILVTAAAFLTLGQALTSVGDFAFRLEYGSCTNDVLDTFEGVYVRDLRAMVPPLSIPLTLPQRSIDLVFDAVIAAHFFDYPTDFRTIPRNPCTGTRNANGATTVSCGSSAFAPAEHYKLTVRAAGVTHTVSWHDAVRPSSDEADRLRTLLNTITEMIRALPEVQRLPLAQVGCG
jgi:hypothetical protein